MPRLDVVGEILASGHLQVHGHHSSFSDLHGRVWAWFRQTCIGTSLIRTVLVTVAVSSSAQSWEISTGDFIFFVRSCIHYYTLIDY